MKINYPKAKKICTAAEFNLLEKTKPTALASLKPGELRKLTTQARKYSDKWLDLSRKQGTSSSGDGARSFEKHELFKEAVSRIEVKLAKLVELAPAVKVAKKAVKAVAQKAVAKKAVAKKAVAKKVAKKAATRARSAMALVNQAKNKSINTGLRMAASGKNSRVKGHVSAQGRRNQAARSARKR